MGAGDWNPEDIGLGRLDSIAGPPLEDQQYAPRHAFWPIADQGPGLPARRGAGGGARPAIAVQEINVEKWLRGKNWHDPHEDDPHAPNAVLYTTVGEDWFLSNYLISALYDDTIDLTSEMVLKFASPGGFFIDYPPLEKGNEIELWIGYGEERYYIGRAEIVNRKMDFGGDIPVLEVVAHDKSWIMKRQNIKFAGATRTPRRELEAEGTKFKGTVHGFVSDMAKRYGFGTSIHERFKSVQDTFHRPKIQDDWAVLQSLANFHGAVARVNWSHERKEWVLLFEDVTLENSSGRGTPQEKHYTFTYAEDESSTLMTPVFREAIDDQVNEIQAWFWDPKKKSKAGTLGEWILLTDDEPYRRGTSAATKKVLDNWQWWKKLGQDRTIGDPKKNNSAKLAAGGAFPKDPTRIKIAAGGYSVEIADVQFATSQDAAQYLRQWFEKNRSAFTVATGRVPGLKILSGEHHVLSGEDLRSYAGVYFFSKVTHEYGNEGYVIDFVARQMLR